MLFFCTQLNCVNCLPFFPPKLPVKLLHYFLHFFVFNLKGCSSEITSVWVWCIWGLLPKDKSQFVRVYKAYCPRVYKGATLLCDSSPLTMWVSVKLPKVSRNQQLICPRIYSMTIKSLKYPSVKDSQDWRKSRLENACVIINQRTVKNQMTLLKRSWISVKGKHLHWQKCTGKKFWM